MTIETNFEVDHRDGMVLLTIRHFDRAGNPASCINLTQREMDQLKDDIETWLKTPTITLKTVNCNDRSAHKPHIEKGGYCSGRAFDVT